MTDKLRYAYDPEEGFLVDMHNPQPGGLGTELLPDEVVDKLNALEQELEQSGRVIDVLAGGRDKIQAHLNKHYEGQAYEIFDKAVGHMTALEQRVEGLEDALEHCGYDPTDCIDCGGPPHNEWCRFWKLRDFMPALFALASQEEARSPVEP